MIGNWHEYFKEVQDLLVTHWVDLRMAPGAMTAYGREQFERQAWIAWSSGRTTDEFCWEWAGGDWSTK
jgi:hypothetical protein